MKRKLAIIVILSFILCIIGGCGIPDGIKGVAKPASQGQENNQGQNNNPEQKENSGSSSIPSGVYWAAYTNIPDKPDSSDGITAEGLYYVQRIEIGEPSTEELIAFVEFPGNENLATYTNPNDHSKYWVERIIGEGGKTTGIKLASTAANNFYINLNLYTVAGKTPALNIHSLKSDDGVHSPDGSVLSDPYKDPEIPIAGFKELKFSTSYEQGNKIRQSVEQAGYPTWSVRFENGEYRFDTMKELEGRAKIEETVLKPNGWKIDEGSTKGNVGVYSRASGFTGSIGIEWTFAGVPFTIEISDAKLVMRDDGPDETNYTLTGTAEIKQKSFISSGQVYTLSDSAKKPVNYEYGFKVRKIPGPAVRWSYAESWQYKDQNGNPYLVSVNFSTNKSPTEIGDVPVADVDKIDGSYNMGFMMPSFGGTATWGFQPENQ